MRRRPLLVLSLAVLPLLASADSWPPPETMNVFSPDGTRFVRIVPGSSLGETEGFAGEAKGPHARGLFYALQPDRSYRLVADVELVNPMAPVDALVTDRGELITFDNWHNAGFGKVVAMYGAEGALRASYTLEDLYGKEAGDVPRSVSSRWWRCHPLHFVDRETQTKVYVREWRGGGFVFSLPGRSFEYEPGTAPCSNGISER